MHSCHIKVKGSPSRKRVKALSQSQRGWVLPLQRCSYWDSPTWFPNFPVRLNMGACQSVLDTSVTVIPRVEAPKVLLNPGGSMGLKKEIGNGAKGGIPTYSFDLRGPETK